MVATVKTSASSKVTRRIKEIRQKLEDLATRVQSKSVSVKLHRESDAIDRIAEEIQDLVDLPASAYVARVPSDSLDRIEELEWQLQQALKGKIHHITATIIANQRNEIDRLKKLLREKSHEL